MDSKTHAIIGSITGGILGILASSLGSSEPNILYIFVSALFGSLGDSIPDTLEPAKSWNHRKFFHSQRVLTGLILVAVVLILSSFLWTQEPIGYMVLGGIGGYMSHLFADSTTPMGLPP